MSHTELRQPDNRSGKRRLAWHDWCLGRSAHIGRNTLGLRFWIEARCRLRDNVGINIRRQYPHVVCRRFGEDRHDRHGHAPRFRPGGAGSRPQPDPPPGPSAAAQCGHDLFFQVGEVVFFPKEARDIGCQRTDELFKLILPAWPLHKIQIIPKAGLCVFTHPAGHAGIDQRTLGLRQENTCHILCYPPHPLEVGIRVLWISDSHDVILQPRHQPTG